MVSEKRLVCEESQEDGQEEEQTDSTATLLPTTPYSNDTFKAATSCTLTLTRTAAGEEEEGGEMLTSVGGSWVQTLRSAEHISKRRRSTYYH